MKIIRRISIQLAATLMLVILLCVVVFHLLVIVGAIPYSIVWGGRLESASQMYLFETVSITINLTVIAIVGMKVGYLKAFIPERAIIVLLWVLTILFALNTLGNIFSKTTLETFLFTPLTFISSVLCYRLAIER
ncbi:MAG: hypothetical protein OEW08_12300 [Gammaproteobacteria bacterium]|nr:hypothetical protein [Gammaproteobacteria bacterium]